MLRARYMAAVPYLHSLHYAGFDSYQPWISRPQVFMCNPDLNTA